MSNLYIFILWNKVMGYSWNKLCFIILFAFICFLWFVWNCWLIDFLFVSGENEELRYYWIFFLLGKLSICIFLFCLTLFVSCSNEDLLNSNLGVRDGACLSINMQDTTDVVPENLRAISRTNEYCVARGCSAIRILSSNIKMAFDTSTA